MALPPIITSRAAHHQPFDASRLPQCWTLGGAHVYTQRGLRTVELRPFTLPPGPAGRGAPGAPAFPPICRSFVGTHSSCRMEERCPCSHARVRAWC